MRTFKASTDKWLAFVALSIYQFFSGISIAQQWSEEIEFEPLLLPEGVTPDFRHYFKTDMLKGLSVVIDPGHGGLDSGASRLISSRLCEDEHTYDVACRLRAMVKAASGEAVMTIFDNSSAFMPLKSISKDLPLPPDEGEFFTVNGEQVVASTEGLSKRTLVANGALAENENTVFVSIHFDRTTESLHGVSIIAPPGEQPPIVYHLEDSFRSIGLLRKKLDEEEEYYPVVQSGNPENGIRNLFVLNPEHNKVPNRVLIELGNISHPIDIWKVTSAEIREVYACTIYLALVKFWRVRSE